MDGPILLLTHSGDFYTIDRVLDAVRARGADAVRIDTDRYPTQIRLSTRFDGGTARTYLNAGPNAGPNTGPNTGLNTGLTADTATGHAIALDAVPAVWARRLWPGRLPSDLDPRHAAHCHQQARDAFYGLPAVLDRAYWLNPIAAQERAESKLLQLRLAGDLGLRVPPTLVTNDPDEARAFFRDHDGDVVTKLLVPLSQTMDGSGDYMYTTRLRARDLDAIDALQLAPQIFQRHVDKACELRVIAVGAELFVGAIDARASARGHIDWRRAAPGDRLAWTRAELPADVAALVHALMARLGLEFGALDFIVTPAGEHVFLEINPAGEWGWLERDLGLPIADAIARALVAGAQQRRSAAA